MSRSNYSDDCSESECNLWAGAVRCAIRGTRGQRLLREMAEAMDAMPEKKLIANALERNGAYCALGVVGKHRGLDMTKVDADDPDQVGMMLDIARAMAAEIAYRNDETMFDEYEDTAHQRWQYMRGWVANNIIHQENTNGR